MTACAPAPDAPAATTDETIVLQPSDVHTFGTSRSIAVVRDLEVLPDGRVWILNSAEPLLIGFGRDGAVTGEYGAHGGGPGEFGAPVGFVAGGIGGKAWVLDRSRSSLIEISGDGVAAELRLPRDSIPPGSLVPGRDLTDDRIRSARFGNEVVLARTSGSIRAGMFSFWHANWGADLLALDPATGAVRGVLSLASVLGDSTSGLRVAQGSASPPFPLWFRLWAACPDGIAVYDRLRAEVRTFTADGAERTATPLPRVELETVTPRQFARSILGLLLAERLGTVDGQVAAADSTRLLNDVVGEIEGDPAVLAAFLPRYVDFRCAPDGTLWLRPFDIDTGGLQGGRSWYRKPPGGSWQEVWLPDRFDALRFTADRIWGVQRDELDVASVAWIGVPGAR